MARALLKNGDMDFVFNCASCHGPLIARQNLRGRRVQCAHCSGGIEAHSGAPVTEAVVSHFLDQTGHPANRRMLRRVKPAARLSSPGTQHQKPTLKKTARISR